MVIIYLFKFAEWNYRQAKKVSRSIWCAWKIKSSCNKDVRCSVNESVCAYVCVRVCVTIYGDRVIFASWKRA